MFLHKLLSWLGLNKQPLWVNTRRPKRSYSKKAWSYIKRGQPTIAQQLYWHLGE